MDHSFAKIIERIHAFIGGGNDDFDDLARALFALQYKHVAPYQRFCESRGITPETLNTIPALPTTAFRDYEITSLDSDNRPTVFHSSGTTTQSPSKHYHNSESITLYEQSLKIAFAKNIPLNPITLSLTPSPDEAPQSSLVHMLNALESETVFTGTVTSEGWTVDIPKTLEVLRSTESAITIMGTAFSFVHLCDAIEPIALRPGSRIMETGGYKNQSRELSKPALHELIRTKLGVSAKNVHCEYGMCELSSQAYAIGTGPFQFPKWARARIVSPEDGQEMNEGKTGLLEIIDLANARSVLAIRTADLATRRANGFELMGRAGDSEPRGCSLNALDLARKTETNFSAA